MKRIVFIAFTLDGQRVFAVAFTSGNPSDFKRLYKYKLTETAKKQGFSVHDFNIEHKTPELDSEKATAIRSAISLNVGHLAIKGHEFRNSKHCFPMDTFDLVAKTINDMIATPLNQHDLSFRREFAKFCITTGINRNSGLNYIAPLFKELAHIMGISPDEVIDFATLAICPDRSMAKNLIKNRKSGHKPEVDFELESATASGFEDWE